MKTGKVRLDRRLVASGLAPTRERARALILAGCVEVSGRRLSKPGASVGREEPVALGGPDHPYVSRGGVKLEGALRSFRVTPEGRVAMDVGASTGGFTHCLLLQGARRVYAVDVGYGQFAWSLRTDPRVVLLERTNVRSLAKERVPEPIDLAVMDVSFISLKKVIPCVVPFLAPQGEMICLVKPQFEAGKGKVGKGGVVRNPEQIREILADMRSFVEEQKLLFCGVCESVLQGPKGNREFFLYARQS
jgi:23S rRNA (cytidine1920-2'-O)/16S rRNA (cytidine1409-2'-O)-methyltransferase